MIFFYSKRGGFAEAKISMTDVVPEGEILNVSGKLNE